MTALISGAVVIILIVAILIAALKVLREYERAVVFRLGRLLPEPKGPGLFILIPVVDRMVRVDLRTITLNIPPQEVITKDNVPVRVNAVAYFRIVEPKAAIVQVENFMVATSQIAQTTLRSVLGQHQLDELLSERDKINAILQGIIDEQGFQCAFCMSGFVMATLGFLKTNPDPTRLELAHGISGNLCRCQDYDKILTALMRGAENLRRVKSA